MSKTRYEVLIYRNFHWRLALVFDTKPQRFPFMEDFLISLSPLVLNAIFL